MEKRSDYKNETIAECQIKLNIVNRDKKRKKLHDRKRTF